MVLDADVLSHLVEIGFPVEACRKAVYRTGNTGVENAMNWLMQHLDDPGMIYIDNARGVVSRATSGLSCDFVIKWMFDYCP